MGGGIATALTLSLLTGCTAHVQKPIKNVSVGKSHLYVNFDHNKTNFTNVTNRGNKEGFLLNDYSPYKFDTHKSYGFGGGFDVDFLWSLTFEDSLSAYQVVECGDITIYDMILATALLPFTFLMGFNHPQVKYFDYNKFDKDAKEWTSEHKINPKILIATYDSLLDLRLKDELFIALQTNQQIQKLNDMYFVAKKLYAHRPTINKIYDDKAKLYNGEQLSAEVRLVENKLYQKQFSFVVNYQVDIDNVFPCVNNDDCMTKIDTARNQIDKNLIADKEKLRKVSMQTLVQYGKDLKKRTKILNVNYDKELLSEVFHADDFHDKTINYKIIAKDKVDSQAKKLDVKYEIVNVDYSNIYPSYTNSNSDLKIIFSANSGTLTFSNNLEKFIQINSVSLYYGNGVYVVTDSANSNYSTELSPKSFSSMKLWQIIPEARYENLTKTKALATNIKFGFAVKYTVGNSSNKRTIYKTKEYNLYPLIKNIK